MKPASSRNGERLPEVTTPHARRTRRVSDITRLLRHGAGGRPAERLAAKLGLLGSGDTILRHLEATVPQPAEVADIFRRHGAAWRAARAGHLSLAQLNVMSAIETCRTVALGGHVEGCNDCGHRRIAYNSSRNRHCPKCQALQAREWLAAREADLLPVGYFHVVFTLAAEVSDRIPQQDGGL